jgi:hypothetical protein
MAEENQIIILTFPSHTIHLLQPLDDNVYGSFRAAWRNEIDAHMRRNPGKSHSHCYDFHSLFNPSYEISSTPKVIRAGFRKLVSVLSTGMQLILRQQHHLLFVTELILNVIKRMNPSCTLQPATHPTCTSLAGKRCLPKSTPYPFQRTLTLVHPVAKALWRVSWVNPEVDPNITIRRRSRKRKQSADKTTENNDDNSTCSLCRRDHAYDLKKSMGAKWIQCCLEWYLNKCENLSDNFVGDIYMCSQCDDP